MFAGVVAPPVPPPTLAPPEFEVPAVPDVPAAPVPAAAVPPEVPDEPLLALEEPELPFDAPVDVVEFVDVVVAPAELPAAAEPPCGTVSGGALTAFVAAVELPPPHADSPIDSDAPATSETAAAVS